MKEINNKYGHLAGNEVIRHISIQIGQNVRRTDIAARHGGDEFAILMPNTSLRGAKVISDRLAELVRNSPLNWANKQIPLTVSVGLAVFPQMAIDKQSLVEASDRALYRAKREGRNRVCFPIAVEEEERK